MILQNKFIFKQNFKKFLKTYDKHSLEIIVNKLYCEEIIQTDFNRIACNVFIQVVKNQKEKQLLNVELKQLLLGLLS